MTQEVQPLTWQKRTNIEEHQQFFSKINEIIANLAPTVNEAEQAIAQATQAIASANAAINTANAASANADAASQQAQASADTVAGYDTRMTAAESKNTQQDTAISALQTADGQNVKLTGDQNITGMKTVPTETTGVRSQQLANSTKIGAELDNYAPMVRTTGNVQKYGKMEMMNGLNGYVSDWRYVSSDKPMTIGQWCIFAEISKFSTGAYRIIEFIQGSNTAACYGKMLFNSEPNTPDAIWISIKGRGGNNPLTKDAIKILTDGSKIYLAWQKNNNYGSLRARQYASVDYGNTPVYNQDITWLKKEEMPILDNLDAYTVFDVIE